MTRIFLFSVLLAIALNARSNTYVIQNVNLVPMTEELVLENYSVLIDGGSIKKICAKADSCQAADAKKIDGSGKYLMPGLSDMHAHVEAASPGSAPPAMVGMSKRVQYNQLRQYVLFGVTTIRDTGGGVNNLRVRGEIEAGEALGPRLFTSRFVMDGKPGLHPATQAYEFDDPELASEYVEESIALGYDFIKIYSTLTTPVFDAIMKTATENNVPVIGHVPMQIDIEYALKSGMRSIEHLSGYDVSCAGPDAGIQPTMADVYQGWNYCTEEQIRQLAAMTTKYNVWNDPTLIVVESLKTNIERDTASDPEELKYTNPLVFASVDYLYSIFTPRARAGLKAARPTRLALVKALNDAGAPLLIGTDTGAAGYNVHQELALFVEAGLSPYQALHAATVEAARYFDMQGKFGTVTEGASADLVLLNANPLEDISNAKDINGVMLRGVWLDSEFIQNTTAEILASNEEELERLRALMAEAAATRQPE